MKTKELGSFQSKAGKIIHKYGVAENNNLLILSYKGGVKEVEVTELSPLTKIEELNLTQSLPEWAAFAAPIYQRIVCWL